MNRKDDEHWSASEDREKFLICLVAESRRIAFNALNLAPCQDISFPRT